MPALMAWLREFQSMICLEALRRWRTSASGRKFTRSGQKPFSASTLFFVFLGLAMPNVWHTRGMGKHLGLLPTTGFEPRAWGWGFVPMVGQRRGAMERNTHGDFYPWVFVPMMGINPHGGWVVGKTTRQDSIWRVLIYGEGSGVGEFKILAMVSEVGSALLLIRSHSLHDGTRLL